jgi:hypothetical protein
MSHAAPIHWRRRSRFRGWSQLRLVYGVPDPFASLEAWHCFTHRDLAHRARAELLVERGRLRGVIALSDRVHPWHEERLARVEAALRDLERPAPRRAWARPGPRRG